MQIKKFFRNVLTANLLLFFLICSFFGLNEIFIKRNRATVYAEIENVGYGEYLSNLTPIEQTIGYSNLKIDENMNGERISFIVGGEKKSFEKGLMAHATSTLVYDLGTNHHYDYFSTYLGIDASQNGKGNVKFSAYTSTDNENWTTILEPTTKSSSDEAIFLNVSIKNIRYLKIYFDSNGVNYNDHSGLGDCKLFSTGYNFERSEDLINPVEYYNNLFAEKSTREILENYELQLMQHKFVDNIGYNKLKNGFLIGDYEQDRRQMLGWLFNDSTALKDFVTGGIPNGGDYVKALKVLTRLYKEHSSDLSDTTALFEPEAGSTRNRGDVYRTMMIAIALTNAKDVYGWVNSSDILDPLARYEAFKYTYLAEDYHLRYGIFENLCVEEMRYLMSSRVNSEEIYWLNAYATIKYGSATYPDVYSPHRHIKYGRDWNYAEKGYYKGENFEQYNQKYMLEQFGVHLTTTPRLWMAMDGSQICWGISYLGTNFASAFGVPSHYVRQPDHAAFFVFDKDENGRTVWTIDNDIFGWTKTWMNEDTVGNGNNRMMCDWGTTGSEQVTHSNGTYILLSATALDNQENYEKAELVLSLKSLTPVAEQETLFRDVLTFMPYHLDAWYELIKLYINTNKSDEDLTTLAEEIAQNMYCFPLPMHELIALIENELTARNTDSSTIQLAKVRNIDNLALQKSTNVSNDENAKQLIAQTSPCVEEAKYLLGIVEEEKLATFSFDGENKNKLMFNSNYTSVRYKYSIDGGTTWSDSLVDMVHELTDSELNSISSPADIYIWLEGWGTTIDLTKAFKIDILDGVAISNLELNDNEDMLLGTYANVEYSLDNLVWQSLSEESTFVGNQTVYVRYKRHGTTLQGEIATFEFTDNFNPIRSYIPISSLQLFAYSSEETSRNDYAKYAIDGKLSTRWHTKWSGGDADRFITVKLNDSKYISGLDYTPIGGNGTMLACEVYVSQDGENWTLATSTTGWENNNVKKSLTFTPVYGQYIKVVGTNTVGGFCSARLLEFFEDTTLKVKKIINIEIENKPKQEIYVISQKINYSGLKVRIIFQDNTTAIIPNELLTLEDVTFSQVGVKEIVVKYNETVKTTFVVEVIDEADGVARVGVNYYSSLKNALLNISDGDIIELLKDIEVVQSYSISNKITINGNNNLLKRQDEFLSAIFMVTGSGNLTLKDLIIDGGAIWSGDTNSVLERGTINSGICATSPIIKVSDNAMLVLNNCELRNNCNNYSTNAQNAGGAIFLGNTSKATLSNTTIKDCYSYTFGSAIYIRDNANLVINSGVFSGNSGTTTYNTTVICVDNSSTCVVNGGIFENNLANAKGGVFWVSNGRLDINGGKFRNNYATNGAGIYLNGGAKVNIADFEEMEEIYLPDSKKIYILGLLLDKTLNIKMSNPTNDTVVAICEDEELKYKVLKSINVADKLLYVDGDNIKINEKTSVKAVIKLGEREISFVNLIQAINCADSGDAIILYDDVTLSEDLYIEKALDINLFNFQFDGIQHIKTQSMCKVEYTDNLIKICDHVYNQNVVYTWSEDNTKCTARGNCQCGKEYMEISTASQEVTTFASYEDDEITTYVAKYIRSEFSEQEKNVITGARLIKPKNGNKIIMIILICCGLTSLTLILSFLIRHKRKKCEKKEL